MIRTSKTRMLILTCLFGPLLAHPLCTQALVPAHQPTTPTGVYLNPDSGRFWTMDSYEGKSSEPLSLHKYLYCSSEPVNGLDPSGRMTLGELQTTIYGIATAATTLYYRYGYEINRVVVLVYEATTGELVYLGKGGSVAGAQAVLSKVEGGIGTWVKAVSQVGENFAVGTYGYLRELLRRTGRQANHLNQAGGYTAIPREAGAAVDLLGNALKSGTAHNQFHVILERFWDAYRKGGEKFGSTVNNRDYLNALGQALESVKDSTTGLARFTKKQVDALVELAEKEQLGYGYHDGVGGLRPEVPASMNLKDP